MSPQEKWEKLRADFLSAVRAIDEETPWREVEPKWWLKMRYAEDAVRSGGANGGAK